jgi:hypothetical protein
VNTTPTTLPTGPGAAPSRRRSLAPYLLAVLLFQVGLFGGLMASPYSPISRGAGWAGMPDAATQMVRWRQSMANPARDPRWGSHPRLRLVGESGQPLDVDTLAQRRTVLVFANGESG